MLLLYTIMRKNLPPPDLGLPPRNFRSPPVGGEMGIFWNYEFTISTETIMHLIYPPKFCLTLVFDFFREDCNTQEKLKTMAM